MKLNGFNLGKSVVEGEEKNIYVDFELYRFLFIKMLDNSDVPENIISKMLHLYDNSLRIKKKRMRHKKLKELFPYMEILMTKSNMEYDETAV